MKELYPLIRVMLGIQLPNRNRFKQLARVLTQFNHFQEKIFKRMNRDFFNKYNRLEKSRVTVKFKWLDQHMTLSIKKIPTTNQIVIYRRTLYFMRFKELFKLTSCNNLDLPTASLRKTTSWNNVYLKG